MSSDLYEKWKTTNERLSRSAKGGDVEVTAADRKRAEIVSRAAELFDERGYYRTSVDDIAHAAGIRKPTLYHYFQGKQEILFWIYQEYSDRAVRRQEERLKTDIPPVDAIRELIYDVIGALDTHPAHARVFFEYQHELPEEYQRQIKDQRRRYQRSLEEFLQRGIESGDFRPVDVSLVADAIFGMVNWTYQWYRPGGRLRAEEVAEAFFDLVIRGLAANTKSQEK